MEWSKGAGAKGELIPEAVINACDAVVDGGGDQSWKKWGSKPANFHLGATKFYFMTANPASPTSPATDVRERVRLLHK